MDAGYQTAAREAEDAFVERRSRFLALYVPFRRKKTLWHL